jgi:deoxyribodipyrimidine photo-lyase
MDVSNAPPILLWFRLDLRLADHAALATACSRRAPVIPVFIHDPGAERPWSPGLASRWWLGRSLQSLGGDLRKRGSRLILRHGGSLAALRALAKETGARELHFSRRYEPAVEARDARLMRSLEAEGLEVVRHEGNLLRPPEAHSTRTGTPYKVFTPFWRTLESLGPPHPPLEAPRRIPAPARWPASASLASPADMGLLRAGEEEPGWAERWKPGEAAAAEALERFVRDNLEDYIGARDVPADPGTSHLSPRLHFGEITPRQAWHAVCRAAESIGSREAKASAATFLRELGWREFAHHILVHFPWTTDKPLRPEFERFPWRRDAGASGLFGAWREGGTGFPFIDAGMRELRRTGFMHNRARMAAASFLVKDLMVPWQEGARWFWDRLVDADLAVNSLNWQWVAGCGADAAPYFRIFNPVTQGERFDPRGDYVRRWVPELAPAGDGWIHRPFEAAPMELRAAGIEPGRTYPDPLVDHGEARDGALAAFRSLR